MVPRVKDPDADTRNMASFCDGLGSENRQTLKLTAYRFEEDFRISNLMTFPAEKRLFYVGVTRAQRLLMYVAERDNWNNPPSPFLGAQGVNIL